MRMTRPTCFCPPALGGLPVRWIIVDDAIDPVIAVKNAKKFVDEDRVDVILGSSSVVTSVPMFGIAAEQAKGFGGGH